MSATPDTHPRPIEPDADPPLAWLGRRARAFAGPRDQVGWLVLGGRVTLIWLPVFVLFAQSLSALRAVVAATVVSAVWTMGLRAALSAYFTLGPAVASAVGTITGLVAISALDLWIPDLDLRAAGLAEAAVAVFVLSAAWEHIVRSIAKRRVLVVGTGGCASEVLAELNNGHRTPFTMLGLVDERPDGTTANVPRLGSFDELAQIVAEQRPDIVILTDDGVSAWAVDPLLDLGPAGFRVVGVSHFIEHALGRVPLHHLTPTWFMSMLHLRQKPYTRVAKRVFDLAVASLGLLLALPLLPVLVLLVRLTPGPVIYRQTRVGEGGRHFTILKLRTMRADAEDEGSPCYAQVGDARVTRVGRLLRQTHLDELPQLWNVVRGEMSIVGPRPERPQFVDLLEQTVPFWTRRLLVKPGITGWAQLRCGYACDAATAAEKLSYDLWYLRNRNVVVDLAICFKTITSLVFRSGR
ncbi:MAG: exopolysaccharide biosynthesis polyprenyl glycosylphosphotransferase [Gaiellaceae bacterium]